MSSRPRAGEGTVGRCCVRSCGQVPQMATRRGTAALGQTRGCPRERAVQRSDQVFSTEGLIITREVGPGAGPYPHDACRAKPDLDAASYAMHNLYDHPDIAAEFGHRGRASFISAHDATTAVGWFGKRFVAWIGAGGDR